jgi:putative DNA primase/helicase
MVTEAERKILKSRKMTKDFIDKQPIYYDEGKKWWSWSKGKKQWLMIDETELFIQFDKIFPQKGHVSLDPRIKSILKNSLKRFARINKPKEMKKTFVQFKDTILDLETMDEFEATPKYFTTNPIPWKLGNDDKTPVMDKIFKEWVGEENVKVLYQIIAYCILPDYPLNRIFCLRGEGSNGKSKFLDLLTKFVGNNNVVTTELDTLLSSRFEQVKLFKKLACVMGEINKKNITQTSVLKRLSGGDLVRFELKFKNPFDGYNYAKIIISTNKLPRTEDPSRGFYRRWLMVDFLNEFPETKDILEDIPEKEYYALTRKSINVLKELLKKREFDREGTIEERKKKYEEASNPFGIFLDRYCKFNKDYYVPFKEFFERFEKYLKDNGRGSITSKSLGTILSDEGYKTENKYDPETQKNRNVIWGLKLKE